MVSSIVRSQGRLGRWRFRHISVSGQTASFTGELPPGAGAVSGAAFREGWPLSENPAGGAGFSDAAKHRGGSASFLGGSARFGKGSKEKVRGSAFRYARNRLTLPPTRRSFRDEADLRRRVAFWG